VSETVVDKPSRVVEQLGVHRPPVEPGNLVVLAVAVVVPALASSDLVAAEQHRHALGEEQRGEEVPLLSGAELPDLGIVARTLRAAVPRAVVVRAVAILLEVRFVVLLVVRDQVVEREPVVRRDEVDAGRRPTAACFVEVRAPGEAVRELAEGAVDTSPVVPNGVAIFSVPFGPEVRKVADLVTAPRRGPRARRSASPARARDPVG
jgi:hypothetical protein